MHIATTPLASTPTRPFPALTSSEMVVRIRLARFGRTRQPIYNIVVSQARSARGSKPMEVLGTYDPLPRVPLANDSTPDTMTNADGEEVPFVPKKIKDVKLDISRTKYWLGVGAQPSEPVEKLLCMIGLMEPRPSRTRTPTGSSGS